MSWPAPPRYVVMPAGLQRGLIVVLGVAAARARRNLAANPAVPRLTKSTS